MKILSLPIELIERIGNDLNDKNYRSLVQALGHKYKNLEDPNIHAAFKRVINVDKAYNVYQRIQNANRNKNAALVRIANKRQGRMNSWYGLNNNNSMFPFTLQLFGTGAAFGKLIANIVHDFLFTNFSYIPHAYHGANMLANMIHPGTPGYLYGTYRTPESKKLAMDIKVLLYNNELIMEIMSAVGIGTAFTFVPAIIIKSFADLDKLFTKIKYVVKVHMAKKLKPNYQNYLQNLTSQVQPQLQPRTRMNRMKMNYINKVRNRINQLE